jgi:putative Holliday junction resolvase
MSPLLGIDYGPARIGLALSDPTDTIATALGTHRVAAQGAFLERLRDLVHHHGVTGLILGLPLTTAGEEGDMARQVRAFGDRLAAETGLPVIYVDERFSSREASGLLRLGGRRRLPKEQIDAMAAALILQQHLDSLHRPPAVEEDPA